MPHIHGYIRLVVPGIRDFVRDNAEQICKIVAEETGYAVDKIAFIPHPIPEDDEDLCKNVASLEMEIHAGSKVRSEEQAERTAERIKDIISVECPGADNFYFGVFLLGHGVNGYAVHKLD